VRLQPAEQTKADPISNAGIEKRRDISRPQSGGEEFAEGRLGWHGAVGDEDLRGLIHKWAASFDRCRTLRVR
jgi:hypothetical protein